MAQGKNEQQTAARTAAEIVEETIERTLATYRGRVPAEMLESLRDLLQDTLTTDPYAVGLSKAIEARTAPLASEVVEREDARKDGGRSGKSGAEGA